MRDEVDLGLAEAKFFGLKVALWLAAGPRAPLVVAELVERRRAELTPGVRRVG